MNKLNLIILLIFFFLILTSGCTTQTSNPTGQVTITAQPKCTTEKYTESICEDVPFQDLECEPVQFTERLCHKENIVFNTDNTKNVKNSACTKFEYLTTKPGLFGTDLFQEQEKRCLEYSYYCEFEFNNLDDSPAKFEITKGIYKTGSLTSIDLSKLNTSYSSESKQKLYVEPQSSQNIVWSFKTNVHEPFLLNLEDTYCNIYISAPPQKDVCQNAVNTREDCKTVTKYKTECKDVPRTKEVCS